VDPSRRQLIQALATWVTCPGIASSEEAGAAPGAASAAQSAAGAAQSAASAAQSVAHRLSAPGITLLLSAHGQIVGIQLGTQALDFMTDGGTVLADCDMTDAAAATPCADGALEFCRRYVHRKSGDVCTVVDRFSATDSSIRWHLTITGDIAPWSTSIETRLRREPSPGTTFWTAWDNAPGASPGWNDPLVPAAYADLDLRYGGHVAEANAFCLPLMTMLDAADDIALSLVQSPEDPLLDMHLYTSRDGVAVLSRHNHRISAITPVSFTMDLVPHAADWRAALGWMADRYPDYVNPADPRVRALDGCGAYSAHRGRLDHDKLRRMAFSLNWNAHFDFPFLGMMMPPVGRNTGWTSWAGRSASLSRMARYERSMHRAGFHVLEYFVLTECGNGILPEPPPRKAPIDADLWRDANDFVHYAIPAAVVRASDGGIQFSDWHDNVVVDPAEPVWREQLLAQAWRLVRELPDSDGICIDRMDWLTLYNVHRDDGQSWIDGAPARSLLNSWRQTGAEVAAIMHGAGKVVYANPLVRRLDTVRFIDGFYDEYADDPGVLNLCALLAIRKPAIAWTRDLEQLRPDPDAFFQRHLHLGVFPTVPFPGADHTIAPGAWAERYYLDYGPLLAAMRGKQWLLKAHAVAVADGAARVNVFEVPGGYAVPITFASSERNISVILDLPLVSGAAGLRAQAWLPGESRPLPLRGDWVNDKWQVTVPTRRGCALLAIGGSAG
jgi:hypothetical protein